MQRQRFSVAHASLALLGVSVITLVGYKILVVNAATIGFFYLILILAVATAGRLIEAVLASVVAMLCYNFFFLPPVGRFTIADPQNWVALVAFLVTALVGSHLSDRAAKQAAEAKRRAKETEQLYAFSRAILLTDAAQPVGSQAAKQIAQIFNATSVVLYDSRSGAAFLGGAEELPGLDSLLRQVVLQGAQQRDEASGAVAWPVTLGGHPVGALATKGMEVSDGAIQALVNLVAIALERVRNEEITNRAEVARQSEEFKSTLLDAIAHEFKTPLTSIKAASTSLLGDRSVLRPEHQELVSIIDEESDRLSLLVTEAVRMAQIDAGKVKLERAAVPARELLESAVAAFAGRGEDRIRGLGDVPPDLVVNVDVDLVALALRQLIDNALKYAPPSSSVALRVEQQPDRVILRVVDSGPGIPERDRERIFDKFYRRPNSKERVPGTGLGLHIAREIARAHDGDLWAEAATPTGSEFCLTLPNAQDKTA